MLLAKLRDTVSVPPLIHDYLHPVVSTEAALQGELVAVGR